jgi:hypothetical protein
MARGLDRGTDEWASPGLKFFFQIQNKLKILKSKQTPSVARKISKFCVRLDLNILNNFLNWVDFKFKKKSCYKFGTDSNLNLL